MNLKAVAAIGLMAVGVGAAAWTVLGLGSASSSANTTYRTATATTTDVQDTAAASGNLVAATIYDLQFGVKPEGTSGTDASASSSSTTAADASSTASSSAAASNSTTGSTSVDVTWPVTEVNVKVGDVVTKGDVLAVADASTARLAVDLATANVEAAKEQRKNDHKGGTPSERASAKDQVRSAKTSLSQAQSSYSSTVAQNNLKLSQATDAVNRARKQYASDKADGASSQVLAQDKSAIQSAEDNLASAKLQAQSGNRQAANQVTSASQQVVTAQRTYDDATSAADSATLATDDVELENAREALREAKAALAAANITAPIDGLVTAVNAVEGEDSTGTAIELQSAQLALSVSVTEDDILSLEVGQAATVAITATGDTANGTVTSVNPVATTSGTDGVVSYTVVVTLDDTTIDAAGTEPDDTATAGASTTDAPDTTATASTDPAASATTTHALPGMSAELTIVIDSADGVVAVPAIALGGTAATGYTVRVMAADGTVETRDVEVGLVTSDLAQVKSGLSDGETVVTGTSADRTASSATSATGRTGLPGGFTPPAGGFQPPAGGFQP